MTKTKIVTTANHVIQRSLIQTVSAGGVVNGYRKKVKVMKTNVCLTCIYYEKCGKPERPMKCMGYKELPQKGEGDGTDKK